MLGLGISILTTGKKQSIIQKFLKRVNKDNGENLLNKVELKQLLPENYEEYSLLGIPSSRGTVYNEVMNNPEMTSANGWNILAGVTYNSSLERFDINSVSGNTIRQDVGLTLRQYKVQITVEDYASGSFKVYISGVNSAVSISANGKYEFEMLSGNTNNNIIALNLNSFVGSISRFSVQLYSAGKLYNIIGTPYLDVLRLSNANEQTKVNTISEILHNVPKIQFDQNGTHLGVLPESIVQNYIVNPSNFLENSWDANRANVTVTENAILAPDGVSMASEISGSTGWQLRESCSGVANNGWFTVTAWVKAKEPGLNDTFLLTVSGNTFSDPLTATANWTRFSFSLFNGTDTNSGLLRNGNSTMFNGYVWGVNVTNTKYPVSLIKGFDAVLTNKITIRLADVISKTAISSNIGQTEGTIHLKVYLRVLSTSRVLKRIAIDANNYFEIITTTSNAIRVRVSLDGVTTNILTSAVFTEGVYDIKFAYKNADYALSVNGVVTTSTIANAFPKRKENLFPQSRSYFGYSNNNVSSAWSQTDPDGGNAAVKITSYGVFWSFYDNLTLVPGATYNISVFAKAVTVGTNNTFSLMVGSNIVSGFVATDTWTRFDTTIVANSFSQCGIARTAPTPTNIDVYFYNFQISLGADLLPPTFTSGSIIVGSDPVFSNVYLGSNPAGTLNADDPISLYGLIPRRLTNLELES